jgi:hypothetical protein
MTLASFSSERLRGSSISYLLDTTFSFFASNFPSISPSLSIWDRGQENIRRPQEARKIGSPFRIIQGREESAGISLSRKTVQTFFVLFTLLSIFLLVLASMSAKTSALDYKCLFS